MDIFLVVPNFGNNVLNGVIAGAGEFCFASFQAVFSKSRMSV
jgi:hypothetical protein